MGKQSDKSTDDLLHDDDAIPSLSSLSGNKRESGGDAAHERIPDDTGVAPSKTLDANTVALHEGLQKAAHWDSRSFSTKLPQDRSSSSVHDQSESDRWNDAGGYEQNKASALRVKSFWSALHDCRQKNTCQELLGRKLWRVVQSKKGQYNLHIFHDDDTARRGVERQMERDFLNAKPVDDIRKIAKDASIKSWDKLKKMMAKDRKYLPQEPKLSAPPSTRMSRHAHLEHVSLRKSEVMARAKLLDRGYAAETDEIYAEPSKKRAHSYKASMVPQKSDDKEEITDSMGFAATHLTEAHVMRETAAKARAGVAKEVKERGELSKLTSTERKMRDEDTDGQAADKALEDGLKEHEEEDVREEQKVSEEAQKELQGFDVPFRHSARQAPAKPNLRAVKKIAPVQHVWRAQAVPGGKGTLALEAKCWQTGEGCGKLMQGLSSHKAQQLRAVAGLDRPAPQLQGRTGLSKLSHNLGSVLGW